MVQTKKFENTFVNEYMAWNLHDQDVLKRGKEEGRKEGQMNAYINTAKNLLRIGIPIETIAESTTLPIEFVKSLDEQKA